MGYIPEPDPNAAANATTWNETYGMVQDETDLQAIEGFPWRNADTLGKHRRENDLDGIKRQSRQHEAHGMGAKQPQENSYEYGAEERWNRWASKNNADRREGMERNQKKDSFGMGTKQAQQNSNQYSTKEFWDRFNNLK